MVDIKAVREALVAIQTDRLGTLVQSALDEGRAAKDILDPGHMRRWVYILPLAIDPKPDVIVARPVRIPSEGHRPIAQRCHTGIIVVAHELGPTLLAGPRGSTIAAGLVPEVSIARSVGGPHHPQNPVGCLSDCRVIVIACVGG